MARLDGIATPAETTCRRRSATGVLRGIAAPVTAYWMSATHAPCPAGRFSGFGRHGGPAAARQRPFAPGAEFQVQQAAPKPTRQHWLAARLVIPRLHRHSVRLRRSRLAMRRHTAAKSTCASRAGARSSNCCVSRSADSSARHAGQPGQVLPHPRLVGDLEFVVGQQLD